MRDRKTTTYRIEAHEATDSCQLTDQSRQPNITPPAVVLKGEPDFTMSGGRSIHPDRDEVREESENVNREDSILPVWKCS